MYAVQPVYNIFFPHAGYITYILTHYYVLPHHVYFVHATPNYMENMWFANRLTLYDDTVGVIGTGLTGRMNW